MHPVSGTNTDHDITDLAKPWDHVLKLSWEFFCNKNLAVSSPPLSTGWGVELKKFQFWQKEGELKIFEFLGK